MSDHRPSLTRLWRKIYWRIIPVVSIAWLCSSIDRGSLGYVAVPLSKDLGLSAWPGHTCCTGSGSGGRTAAATHATS